MAAPQASNLRATEGSTLSTCVERLGSFKCWWRQSSTWNRRESPSVPTSNNPLPDLIDADKSSGVLRADSRADLADRERAVNVLRPVALPSEGFSICRAVADKFDDDRFKVSVVPVSMSGVDVQKAGSSSPPSDALPTASTSNNERTRSWVASSQMRDGTSSFLDTLGVWGMWPTMEESDSLSPSWDRLAAEMSIDKSVCDRFVVISGSTSRHQGSSSNEVSRGDLVGFGRCRGTTNEGSRRVPGALTFSFGTLSTPPEEAHRTS